MKYITAANKRHSHLQLDNNLLACAWPVSPGFGLQHLAAGMDDFLRSNAWSSSVRNTLKKEIFTAWMGVEGCAELYSESAVHRRLSDASSDGADLQWAGLYIFDLFLERMKKCVPIHYVPDQVHVKFTRMI
jgi:hypothetical protein